MSIHKSPAMEKLAQHAEMLGKTYPKMRDRILVELSKIGQFVNRFSDISESQAIALTEVIVADLSGHDREILPVVRMSIGTHINTCKP